MATNWLVTGVIIAVAVVIAVYFLMNPITAVVKGPGAPAVAASPMDTECTGMKLSEAIEIAKKSECISEGRLKTKYSCNNNTNTWWIELDLQKEGCSPACVVNTVDKTAEINWRCTGLIPENDL